MKSICVFCGSSPGKKIEYLTTAQKLGKELAKNNIDLVYGGGNIGIMGELANTVLKYNGRVTGVIPEDLMRREVALLDIQDLRIVNTMHERKQLMSDLADGFIALPGGLGTMEELLEVWTWAQLGIHSKPIGLLNIENYFTELINFLDKSVEEGFVKKIHRNMLLIETDHSMLLEKMKEYKPPEIRKWITNKET